MSARAKPKHFGGEEINPYLTVAGINVLEPLHVVIGPYVVRGSDGAGGGQGGTGNCGAGRRVGECGAELECAGAEQGSNVRRSGAQLGRSRGGTVEKSTRTMVENPLWDYFWRGAKQNSSMYMSYCKGWKPRARKPSARVMEEEEILMQALANEEEDARPVDGAIEIDSDEEYQ
ncbi:hypothetical protein B0H13DRAFT_2313418 [Mycena leptocephala]|nr:hypothetical protein B0H13DRAFT_2313418 [Mycena leptocephala]